MEPITFFGEVPALADSDVELWTDLLGDYISVWLLNTHQFIQDQKQKMLNMALCPFLFGITYSVPHVWEEILHTYAVIEKDRANQTTTLSETELDILEMAETIFNRCSQLVENKNDLKTILNFIYDVEEHPCVVDRIDVNYALQTVAELEVFTSMWAPIKRIYENRKKQAQVCIIYYFKIISQHVILYGRDGVDKADFLKSVLLDLNAARRNSSESVYEINKEVNDKDFTLAVDHYSSIIKNEPLSSLLYSNRAQVFLNVCDYRSALCDCKRAILLDPKNSKNYYIATKAHLKLGQLDKAKETNLQSLEFCTDPLEKKLILEQKQKIRDKSKMTKAKQIEVSSQSEERETDNVQEQYKRVLREGSDCFLSNMYSKAVELFKSALNNLSRSESEGLTVEEDDLLVVWFAYGMSCVMSENMRNIQAAIEKFNAIISRSERFPAAYYGLALAHMSLMRYKEAEANLRTGLELIDKCKDARAYYWPQTVKVIEETVMSIVKKLMEEMLQECLHPPKPDAVCKFHTDSSNRDIYTFHPDYKGHICIKCRANCSIEFHPLCWKSTDNFSKGKHNWKEMLDTVCPTPGCWGLISDVLICRPNQEKSLKLSSQADPKPKNQPTRAKLKMKTESTFKLEKKMERKRLRKERRQEAHGLNLEGEGSEHSQNTAATVYYIQLDEEEAARNMDRTSTLLLKDEPEVLVENKKQKASKIKKKEKKQKQFFPLDVLFKGDEDKERYGVNSLDDNGDFVDRPSIIVNPGMLPAPGSVSGLTTPTERPQSFQPSDTDKLDLALYDFFYRILSRKGPLDLFGKEIEDHAKFLAENAQTRIFQCGGLASFLSSSPRFKVSQNNIVSTASAGHNAVPHQTIQGNPWERHKPEGSIKLNNFHSLNPGAKVFVPHDVPSDTHISDLTKLTDSYPTIGEPEANELPDTEQDSDFGFTTVVNKKRMHAHKIDSAVQPETNKYFALTLASSYNSLDEIMLDHITTPKNSVDNLDKEESETLKTVRASGGVDPSDASSNNHPEIPPAKISPVPLSIPLSLIRSNTSHGSDASDVSGDDIHRVSSPSLSTNSGSSSSRADSSRNSSQMPGQLPSLRPLKAPCIMLPTRGKKRRPLGHSSSKLHSHPHPPSTDGNLIYDGYEEESLSSTTSDKDSSFGDSRPIVTEKSLPTTSDADTPSSTTSKDNNLDTLSKQGQDRFMYAHHQNRTFEPESSHGKFSPMLLEQILDVEEFIPSNKRFDISFQGMKELACSKSFGDDNYQNGLKFKNDESKSDYVHDGAEENIFGNKNLSTLQPPIQQPQSKSRVLNQVAARSEKKVTFDTETLVNNTWSPYNYFSTTKSYLTDNEVLGESVTPSSNPWQNLDNELFSSPSDENFYRKGLIEQNPLISASSSTDSQNSVNIPSKQSHSYMFQPVSLSKDFIQSAEDRQSNPWSRATADKQETQSSLLSDIKYENERSLLSPFEAWNKSSSIDHLLYSSLTYTPERASGKKSTVTLPASAAINNQSNTTENTNQEVRLTSSKPSHPETEKFLPWAKSDADFNVFHSKTIEYNTAEVQTTLSGVEIKDMLAKLKVLKESHAAKEAAHLEKIQMQETLKNCEKQLNREKAMTDKYKQDIKKLVLRIQNSETFANKWKEESDQLVKEVHHLQAHNQTQTHEVQEVKKQLDIEKMKFFSVQMQLLELRSAVSIDRLDAKRQEAVQHFQRLSDICKQADTEGKSLPDYVHKKLKELSFYITSCDSLKQQIDINAQKLKQDLIQGITIDLSQVEVIAPAVPQPPKELSDRSLAASFTSRTQTKFVNKLPASTAHSGQSLNKAPTPAVQLEETEDDDSKAYLSMFYSDSRNSAGSHTNQRDGAAEDRGAMWDEDVFELRKQGSVNDLAQLWISNQSSRQVNPQVRPLSPAVPSGGVLQGTSTLPGKRTPNVQPELSRASTTSNVRPHTQTPRTSAPQKLQENVQNAKQKSHFERIVEIVEETLPGCSRAKIQETVDKLRRNNGGSLFQWTFEDLANRVVHAILDSELGESQADVSAPDEHLSKAWPKLNSIDFQCSICQCEIEPQESLTLSCGHKFHEPCFQEWLKTERTCPNCRSYTLLPQDYPTLK